MKSDVTTSALNFTNNTTKIIGNGHTINLEGSAGILTVNGSTSHTPVLILGDKNDKTNTLTISGDGVARDNGHLMVIAGIGTYAGSGTVKMYDGTTLTNSVSNNAFGGGVAVISGGIYLKSNSSSNGTTLKNSTITDNKSSTIGAGVYYDEDSKLSISGANKIQNNYYSVDENNLKLNNLNIYDELHPVYVTGSLSGSQIGLSDPTLWSDGKEDDDKTAISTGKLTSGYKDNNTDINPNTVFTSDHDTWEADYGDVAEDTYSPGYGSNPKSWENVTVSDYVYAVDTTSNYRGNKVYYNPSTKTVSTNSSKGYALAVIYKNGVYNLTYKKGNEYYFLQILDEPELNTFSLGGISMTYAYFTNVFNELPSEIKYLRTSNIGESSNYKTLSVYEIEQITDSSKVFYDIS